MRVCFCWVLPTHPWWRRCGGMPLLHTPIELWRICHLMARTSVPAGGFICIYPLTKEAEPHLLYQGTSVYLILRKPVSGLSPIVLNLCVCVWSFMSWFSKLFRLRRNVHLSVIYATNIFLLGFLCLCRFIYSVFIP